MSIRDWPEGERPRDKLLLAVFIGSGRRGQNAIEMGRALLAQAGGLRPLLEGRPSRGIGAVAWCRLIAALELGRRYLDADLRNASLFPDAVASARYIKARLCGYPYEVFACLFLDARHRAIAFEELFRGTLDGANVHPREVVRRCLAHNASAVILAHNHPSGGRVPSAADRTITLRLREALRLVEVRVLDHIVVGDGEPISFAVRGWL
jgi:DNA repair protein RadC